MADDVVPPDTLRQVTGYTRPSRQAAWLRANSLPFLVDAWGRPQVHKRALAAAMGAKDDGRPVAAGPNWSGASR